MPITYVPRHRVSKFQEKYGEPSHTSEHGEYIALHYEEIPEGIIKHYGGGYYHWKGRSKGAEKAFEQAGIHF